MPFIQPKVIKKLNYYSIFKYFYYRYFCIYNIELLIVGMINEKTNYNNCYDVSPACQCCLCGLNRK